MSHPTILSIVNSLSAGGAEKQVLLASQVLADGGYRCVVLAMTNGTPNARIEGLIREAVNSGVVVLRPERSFRARRSWLRGCCRLIFGHGRLVIWSWGHRAEPVRMLIQLFRPGARSLVSLRSAHKVEIDRMAWFWRIIDFWRPCYLSNSQLNLDLLQVHIPQIAARSFVVRNALEPAAMNNYPVALPENPDTLEIVMLGNVRIELKGYDLVVELAQLLRAHGLSARIRIGGALSEGVEMRRLIAAAGVQDIIELQGAIHEPYEFLRKGHVFLLFSRVEGMPNALLEAMLMGLPCISTKVGDVANFTHDGTDIRLVEIGDYRAVASILGEWHENWAAARTIGANGRALCLAQFTPEMIGRQLRTVMDQVSR